MCEFGRVSFGALSFLFSEALNFLQIFFDFFAGTTRLDDVIKIEKEGIFPNSNSRKWRNIPGYIFIPTERKLDCEQDGQKLYPEMFLVSLELSTQAPKNANTHKNLVF